MDGMVSCEVCGNEASLSATACPYCGSKRPATQDRREVRGTEFRSVNLEKNMPTVEQALKLLHQELSLTGAYGCKVLVLIHGYGSSGQGGAIKKEVHGQLRYLRDQGRINDYLPGEKCSKSSGHGRHILRRFPFLKGYFDRANPGISLVIV